MFLVRSESHHHESQEDHLCGGDCDCFTSDEEEGYCNNDAKQQELPHASASPMVCNKCAKIISAELGGFSVYCSDSSNPEHETIQCEDCIVLSPETRKFLAKKKVEYEEERAAAAAAAVEPEEYYDSEEYEENWGWEGYGWGGYDHAEECS
jgi:hypothetical protein